MRVRDILTLAVSLKLGSIVRHYVEDNYHTLYYLRTHVTDGDKSKHGLFVQVFNYHAGVDDVILTSNISDATPIFLNNTYLQVTYPDYPELFEWGLVLETEYAPKLPNQAFLPVLNSPTYGDEGFTLNKTGLAMEKDIWGGWIVCNGTLSPPQLFWRQNTTSTQTDLPETCAAVELRRQITGLALRKDSSKKKLWGLLPFMPSMSLLLLETIAMLLNYSIVINILLALNFWMRIKTIFDPRHVEVEPERPLHVWHPYVAPDPPLYG